MQFVKLSYRKTALVIQRWWIKLKKDRNVFVFLIFLLLSTVFWFLNALQKDYTTTIEYPVVFTHIPKGYILKDSKVKNLKLKINSGGFNILRYNLSNNTIPLSINISDMKQVKGKNKTSYYLLSSKYFRSINGQLSNGMRLLEISPDTLFVRLSPKLEKKVPVKAEIKTFFKKQFLQAGDLIIKPDSVSISGDAAIIDSIKEVKTKYTVFKDLNDTLVIKLPLEQIKGVKMSDSHVSLIIPVEPFTESTVSVPIVAMNVPDTLLLKAFPPEITVSFRVSLSRFGSIKSNDFLATIYFTKELIDEKNQRLKVKLEKYPEGLYFVHYSPLFVEYVLERK